uniref:50S ribosomal protein L20 n=1 Tax=Cyanoptyche gloeocystis TaxID=77922 RepID=A0A3G1IWC9_9EUKA|nr:ribosomal protein L20 [Cyanoptyche gloeocystis]
MTRVKRGNVASKRRKKILKHNSGYRAAHSRLFRTANQQIMKALKYAYTDRILRKRNWRALWIVRINAAARFYGFCYSKLIGYLHKMNIILNRKSLAQIALFDIDTFGQISLILKKLQ